VLSKYEPEMIAEEKLVIALQSLTFG